MTKQLDYNEIGVGGTFSATLQGIVSGMIKLASLERLRPSIKDKSPINMEEKCHLGLSKSRTAE